MVRKKLRNLSGPTNSLSIDFLIIKREGPDGTTYEPVDLELWKFLRKNEVSKTSFTCDEIYEAFRGSDSCSRFSLLHETEPRRTWKDTKDAWCAAEAGAYVVPEGKERPVNLLACGRMLT